ncbi:DNA/RNA non-specific endonuclease [Aridibaculum aurantiacum]|uniref:DNA/RNA non-specific endonuclease n=1 Tax=Aridibaculum aurantiacum TaxID=2810307 RepID=UPI001A96540C|nr:DNA/RNA non-specific endonuclease [Aridibaculum aurantiacum]
MKAPASLLAISLLFAFASACKKSIDVVAPAADTTSANISAPVTENFEAGTKPEFQKGYISLTSGIWLFDDALLARSSQDKFRGAQSVRIRGNGSIAMKFDVSNGAKAVVVANATYYDNANSEWQLWVSENNGVSYYQVGNTVTATQIMKNDTFFVNAAAAFRISIRKVSGGNNSINIDDVVITNQVLPPTNHDDHHMLMGNPSSATADVNNPNNYLMDKGYYMMSYSRDRGTPNWVSWHLHMPDLGSISRQDDFRTDFSIPFAWYHVSDVSYSGSGFDRGHNIPSGDRTSTFEANSSTFLMTNIIPQAPQNNQTTWANLEEYSRSLVRQGNELYIIMGSYGVGGTGSNGTRTTIDNGNVTVPSMIWKVVVVLPNGSNDLSRVTTSTRVIAINTPNINSINSNWRTYRTSVDAIEAATGYDILSNVPQHIQQVIEAVVDSQ